MSVGKRIEYVCEVLLRDKTKKFIANYLNVTENSIRNMYKRDSVESKYLVGLAELAGIPISYFFDPHDDVTLIDNGHGYYHKANTKVEEPDDKDCGKELDLANRKIIELQAEIIRLLSMTIKS